MIELRVKHFYASKTHQILKDNLRRRKQNQIWVDQGSKLYNNSFKGFFKIKDIEMYATYNEGKSVVVEIFIRTLKN